MDHEPVDGTLGGVVALVVAGAVGLGAALVLLEDVVAAWLDAFRVVVVGLGTPVGSALRVLPGPGRVVGFCVGRAGLAWVLEGLAVG
jgi:hypothetical protein